MRRLSLSEASGCWLSDRPRDYVLKMPREPGSHPKDRPSFMGADGFPEPVCLKQERIGCPDDGVLRGRGANGGCHL